MNRFTIDDVALTMEKEEMRDRLAERVMQDAPNEDDEEFDDEDDDFASPLSPTWWEQVAVACFVTLILIGLVVMTADVLRGML